MNVKVTLNIDIPSVEVKKKDIALDVDASATILEIVDRVNEINPGFKNAVITNEGEISNKLIIFINGNNVVNREGLLSKLNCDDVVNVIPAIAGG